jgi:hypothetical protein
MTDYTDVPKANALHEESQLVARALENLQAGGTLGSMQITPPPPAPYDPNVPAPPAPVMMMSVNVMVPPPVDAALLTDITAWLNQRLVDIAAELTTLGVAVPPAGSAAWAAQPVPPGMIPPPPTPMMTPPTPIPPTPPYVSVDSPKGE